MPRKLSLRFAPRELFEQMLEYMVIPTFDLVIAYGDRGVIVVKRKIAPYDGVWALPGLRMMKPESIDDTLRRIAKAELGLAIDPRERIFLGQFVGRFKTERNRQDLSTGYLVRVSGSEALRPNPQHFSDVAIVKAIPKGAGAMYRFYLERYFTNHRGS